MYVDIYIYMYIYIYILTISLLWLILKSLHICIYIYICIHIYILKISLLWQILKRHDVTSVSIAHGVESRLSEKSHGTTSHLKLFDDKVKRSWEVCVMCS